MYLTASEAKKYFLKSQNYFTMPLPPYVDFGPLLSKMDKKLSDDSFDELCDFEKLIKAKGVNFPLRYSKDGKYAWRIFEFIHPVIYVQLTNILTRPENWNLVLERLRLFRLQQNVVGTSLAPGMMTGSNVRGASILKWWHGMEQKSIEMALYYECMAETDVMECYYSLDTELIRLALDGVCENGMGSEIVKLLAAMQGGRKIGVPQGSALVDYLVEIGFSYLDVMIRNEIASEKIKGQYLVVRFRDDYRIFAENCDAVRRILRVIAEVLARFGMKLNPAKTAVYDDIISAAVKKDKVEWGMMLPSSAQKGCGISIQRRLLAIYEFSKKYPNSGSLQRALIELYENQIFKLERPGDVYQIISIVVNIMVKNPKVAPVGVAILSKMISFNPGMSRRSLAEKVLAKSRIVSNTDYLEVCLQRLTIKGKVGKKYQCRLCQMVQNAEVRIWNSEWTNLKVSDSSVIDHVVAKKMPFVVPVEEVNVFSEYDAGMFGDGFYEFKSGCET